MSDTAPKPPAGIPALPGAVTVTDELGRLLEVKSLDLLDEMDLIEAAGVPMPPDRWVMIATFAACVRTIDGMPRPLPKNRAGIRDQVRRVGPAGLRAAIKALAPEDVPDGAAEAIEGEPLAVAKN